ncbi:MAG: hypothetical protein U0746_19650 [Gemmataceae bacterium]
MFTKSHPLAFALVAAVTLGVFGVVDGPARSRADEKKQSGKKHGDKKPADKKHDGKKPEDKKSDGNAAGKQPGDAKAQQAAKTEVKVKEAGVLKDAYILMAMANHDYDGHRAKAMAQVEDAIKILDQSIMKAGTNGQKLVALQQEIAVAREAFEAKHQAPINRPQALSNLQMGEAGKLLLAVHGTLVQQKQGKALLDHVDAAIKQVDTALKGQ